MDLQPLNDEQQRAVIGAQLHGSAFFHHLFAFSGIRKEHDSRFVRAARARRAILC